MKVGDLVRRWGTIDPRIGVIQETFRASEAGRVCCRVLWHNGDEGHYFTTSLGISLLGLTATSHYPDHRWWFRLRLANG